MPGPILFFVFLLHQNSIHRLKWQPPTWKVPVRKKNESSRPAGAPSATQRFTFSHRKKKLRWRSSRSSTSYGSSHTGANELQKTHAPCEPRKQTPDIPLYLLVHGDHCNDYAVLIIIAGQYNSPIYIKYPRVLVTKPCRILRRLQDLHVSPNKTMFIIPTHKNQKTLIKLEFMIFRGKPWIHYICTIEKYTSYYMYM